MNSVELGAKERLESGSRKVSVGRCRLADPKMLHAGEAGAIRERERLVFIAQHSFRTVDQLEKTTSLMWDFTR
jgi:hypothetical protein